MKEEELDILDLKEEFEQKKSKPKKFWILLVIFIFSLGLVFAITLLSNRYINSFSKSSGIEKRELFSLIKNGLKSNKDKSENINILILGIDQIGPHREDSLLTDSILISSISPSGKISLISFPRDLWINPLKTKINALYYYGEKSEDVSGIQLASTTMQEVSGLDIHHHLILNLDVLKKIIDTIGGVFVEVEEGFVDEKYPRDDVAPDILPIEDRYKTISFESGRQEMSGEKAIEFIRSRQSVNKEENTDNARSKRQQKVLLSLIEKLQTKTVILNPQLLGNLFSIWQNEMQTSLSLSEIVGLGRSLLSEEISFQTINVPIQNSIEIGILFNPPIQKYKQWVYEPHDPSWQELHEYIQKNLK